jgi:hypothetical protein
MSDYLNHNIDYLLFNIGNLADASDGGGDGDCNASDMWYVICDM